MREEGKVEGGKLREELRGREERVREVEGEVRAMREQLEEKDTLLRKKEEVRWVWVGVGVGVGVVSDINVCTCMYICMDQVQCIYMNQSVLPQVAVYIHVCMSVMMAMVPV